MKSTLPLLCLTLISTFLVNACGGGEDLQFDPSFSVDETVYETLTPPPPHSLSNEFSLPPEDWKFQEIEGAPMDESEIRDYINASKDLTASQADKTKFSAWSVQPLLSLINTAYLLTKDPYYLGEFDYFYHYFLSVRMDLQNRVSYDGSIKAQWERQDGYNIFNVSPYKDYTGVDVEGLMEERKWQSLYFSDINYSGLFLEQMLRFAQIVKEYGLIEYEETAESIIQESVRVIESHESEWISLSDEEGYYIFPKGCPFFIDGVEMPINEAAIFGTALVRLYSLTGDEEWIHRAKSMWTHWRTSFALDQFGYIIYPYVMGTWRKGWNAEDSPSVNSPYSPAVPAPETFHKAALTLQFMIQLEREFPGLLKRYLLEFKKLVLASQEIGGSPIAEFPDLMGFNWPLDSIHTMPPFFNEGWIALMHDDGKFQESAKRDAEVQSGRSLAGLVYGRLLGNGGDETSIVSTTATIHPRLFEDEAGDCTLLESKPSATKVVFVNSSPKHNTLFLYVDKSLKRRIRLNLDAKNGVFEGIMFVPADRCVVLSWLPETEFSYPQTESENQITLTHFTAE
jgi:curved DNA-binding protein CbpA